MRTSGSAALRWNRAGPLSRLGRSVAATRQGLLFKRAIIARFCPLTRRTEESSVIVHEFPLRNTGPPLMNVFTRNRALQPSPVRRRPVSGWILLAVVAAVICRAISAELPIPVTGAGSPATQPIDRLMTNFMAKYKVPGGAAGFAHGNRLVFARGYGYADVKRLEATQPDSLFRIASLSKSLTAAAILKLAEEGKLTLDQPVFALLNLPPPTYAGAAVDPRLASITIRHLLNHTGGWNRNTAVNPDGGTGFDPTVNWTVRAATDMGTTAPASAATIVRWMLGKPLQFDPGTQYQYSNFGYTVLGRIIEKVSGMSYEEFVKTMLARVGIRRMRIGGSRPDERVPGEVTSHDFPGAPRVPSIFPHDKGPVAQPYNFSFQAMDAHGGWIASTVELLRFVTTLDGGGGPLRLLSTASVSTMTARPVPPWGESEEPFYGMGWMIRNTPGNWWHDGSLPGTRSKIVRAGNGFSWVFLFNTRAEDEAGFSSDLDKLGWQALAAVSDWPTNDLFPVLLPRD
jgi:N-acyl-D-amino-acid deacylase